MNSVGVERRQVNGQAMLQDALEAGQKALAEAVRVRLNELLMLAVTHLLCRTLHVRRKAVGPWMEQAGRCHRCKSHVVNRFLRNGYRHRWLLTPLGLIGFKLPRVRCTCGGSVALPLDGLVRPYQRLSDDVDEQIRRWYGMGQSLRQLQRELGRSFIGPLSLQTLLTRIHQVATTVPVPGVQPAAVVLAAGDTQVVAFGLLGHGGVSFLMVVDRWVVIQGVDDQRPRTNDERVGISIAAVTELSTLCGGKAGGSRTQGRWSLVNRRSSCAVGRPQT